MDHGGALEDRIELLAFISRYGGWAPDRAWVHDLRFLQAFASKVGKMIEQETRKA